MPEQETLEYLEYRIAEQASDFDASRQLFWRQQLIFTLATAALAAITTVLIGIGRMLDSQWLAALSLVTSASVTVIAAWEQVLRSKELWIQKTRTWLALQQLQAHIDYEKARAGGVLAQKQIDSFFSRFEEIILAELESWTRTRGTTGERQGDSGPD